MTFLKKEVALLGKFFPQQPQPVVQEPAPKEVTQEESPVETPTSSNTQQTTSQENHFRADQELRTPKNDFSNLFGHGSEIIKEEMAKVKVLELELEMDLILVEEW